MLLSDVKPLCLTLQQAVQMCLPLQSAFLNPSDSYAGIPDTLCSFSVYPRTFSGILRATIKKKKKAREGLIKDLVCKGRQPKILLPTYSDCMDQQSWELVRHAESQVSPRPRKSDFKTAIAYSYAYWNSKSPDLRHSRPPGEYKYPLLMNMSVKASHQKYRLSNELLVQWFFTLFIWITWRFWVGTQTPLPKF